MRKMNANDLLTALRGHETVTFEIRNLGSTTHETKEFEEAVSEIEHALSRSRIRNTATEPPKKEDAGQFDGMTGMVLARTWRGRAIVKDWEIVERDPDEYPQWTCVPDVEGGER